jgi:murein L,D-transpeptidase YcbB/YkuD
MAWRMAKSLDALLAKVNALSPNRDKSSDGGIGNAEHASRSSDHNPWVTDGAMGVVTARDFTNDPAHGMNSEELAEALRASQDDRIKYIISNRKIASGSGQDKPAWQWRPYTGANPHNHHCHVSVKPEKASYDDTREWVIAMTPSAAAVAAPAVASDPLLREGANGPDVDRLQALLNAKGATLKVDGGFGGKTKDAVAAFQAAAGLVADGVCGKYTWIALKA